MKYFYSKIKFFIKYKLIINYIIKAIILKFSQLIIFKYLSRITLEK